MPEVGLTSCIEHGTVIGAPMLAENVALRRGTEAPATVRVEDAELALELIGMAGGRRSDVRGH